MKTLKGICLHILQMFVLVFITATASAQLHADFTVNASPASGCPPVVVSFNDASTGNPTYYKWDLGNGTISYLQNPIATYFNPGTYSVKLVVKNEHEIDSVVKSQVIVVNALPVPAFNASDSTGCFPLKVQFTDRSVAGSGTVAAWQWDFGDGTLSNEPNPQHTYSSSGNFTVILKVTNSNGCTNVITKPALIKLVNGVKAGFSYISGGGCHSPTPITFKNQTTGTGVLTYSWDFGDGNTSTSSDPVNSYKGEGVYSVKLIAKSSFGCSDTLFKENAINIGYIKSDFIKPDAVCAGTRFTLTNASRPETYVGAKWIFDDGTTATTINVDKVYTTPGSHPVKLITDFGSCLDSITKNVNVIAQPKASISANNTIGCAPPFTANFKSNSTNAVSYKWLFGDSTTSTLQNPAHTYKDTGRFTVTLIVTNASGCVDTSVAKDFIKIVAPKIAGIKNLGIKDCIPTKVSPVADLPSDLNVESYFWDFGDGFTSKDPLPTHTYTVSGAYDVKLVITTVSGCTDTYIQAGAVKVGQKPNAKFTADPRDICARTQVSFTDLTTNLPIHDWLWTFGDGGTSSDQNPTHLYNDTGYFNVSLTVFNFGCSDTLKNIKYIHVRPPIAKFDTAFLCSVPLNRNFIDRSIGATSWSWDFGDGTSATARNPSHSYATSGNYPVALTVSNGLCEHTIKKNVLVIKEDPRLDLSQNVACRNARITFNVANMKAENITNYAWFSNGLSQSATITSNNPVAYSYNVAGMRNPAVVITDKLGCKDTVLTTLPLNIYGPKADFESALRNTCFGNTINFKDLTVTDGAHAIQAYTWDFGEGVKQTSNSATISHDYLSVGDYTVKLWVKDSYGCIDSIFKSSYINLSKPVAKFTPSDTMLCPTSKVSFKNESQAIGAVYSWNFGDGVSSNDVSPEHTFKNPGTYPVKLVLVDKNGCADSMLVKIKVFTAHADFNLSDNYSTCPPLVVNTTNKSSNFVQYGWDFGDGGNSQLLTPSHIYTYPGTYTLKLWVRNNGGCMDSLIKKVVIEGPTGTFGYNPIELCNPGTVDFTIKAEKTVSYVWDYNDGTTVFTTIQKASHKYVTPGVYLPKIILQDALGCKVAITGKQTIKVNGIKTDITSNNKLVCDSGSVAFTNSTISNDQIAGYVWDFGDGNYSTQPNPTHSYKDTGFYTVSLFAKTKFGCTDKATLNNYIKIVHSPHPAITGSITGCEPAMLKLSGETEKTDTSKIKWSWSFGNGQVSSLQKPDSQIYKNAGTFNLQLKVTNSDGCSNTIVKQIVIHPKPVVNAGNDIIICKGTSTTLKASGAQNYNWDANTTLSCTTCAVTKANPDSKTTYYVTGSTEFGCTNKDSIAVDVKQPFTLKVDRDDTLCIGESKTLHATGADTYQWTPALYLSNSRTSTPTSRPDSSVSYRVVGTDNMGCFKDTGTVRLRVYPKPKIEITNADNITVPVGSSVNITTKKSADVTNVIWSPAQWLSCASCDNPVAMPKDNITYTVTATNAGKCEASDQVNVSVLCNSGNVYMPNTFSPNGDGVNDIFYPRGVGLQNIRTFKVFNRWGELVFQRNGISANKPELGWDGRFNGNYVQSDVYVYLVEVICQNNIVFPFKGNITVLR